MGRTFLNLQHRQLFVYFCSQLKTNLKLFSIDNLSKLFIYSRSVLIAQNSVNVNTTVGDHPNTRGTNNSS